MLTINSRKVFSPDFLIGKALMFARGVAGSAGLLMRNPSQRSLRLARLILQVTPRYTMLSPTRLAQLYHYVQEANRLGLSGDIVECGTWNGGSAAVMAAACQEDGWIGRRAFWLFDSFQGLPRPGRNDGTKERQGFYEGWCKGDPERVRHIMAMWGLPATRLHIVPGLFETTLPSAPIKTIAVLHIDADWHDSVTFALNAFYQKVTPGGFVVFDDYGKWQGCRVAVDAFFAAQCAGDVEIRKTASTVAYVRKSETMTPKSGYDR